MDALILVDLQNDFCEGGALAVPEGAAAVKVANAVSPHFELVVATQDLHPAGHQSFASNHRDKRPYEHVDLDGLDQVLWPDHCVEHTNGAAFHPDLDVSRVARIFPKGTDPRVDSYSAFFDNGHRKATGLSDYLRERGVTDVYVLGLATDYCVKWTALDAAALGFRVHLIQDGCRGVGLSADHIPGAIAEMRAAGVTITSSADVLSSRGHG